MRLMNIQTGNLTNMVAAQSFYYWSENTMIDLRRQVSDPKIDPHAKLPINRDYSTPEEEDDTETMQICNLNESVLRLEEMAQKRRMTFKLSKDGINGLNALYEELLELNSLVNPQNHSERSRMTPSRVAANCGFSGLKSEDVDILDERQLIQLEHEFGLENVEELPVLQMDALNNYI